MPKRTPETTRAVGEIQPCVKACLKNRIAASASVTPPTTAAPRTPLQRPLSMLRCAETARAVSAAARGSMGARDATEEPASEDDQPAALDAAAAGRSSRRAGVSGAGPRGINGG